MQAIKPLIISPTILGASQEIQCSQQIRTFGDGQLSVRYKREGGKHQRREVAQADVRDVLLAYLKKSKRLSVLHTNEPHWARRDRAGEPGLALTSRSYASERRARTPASSSGAAFLAGSILKNKA